MSKTGIAVAAAFLALALFQGARGMFTSDPVAPPPPVTADTPTITRTPTPEPSPSKPTKLKPFPTFEGEPPAPKTYSTTKDLAAELQEKGIDCANLNFLDQPDPSLTEFSLCDPGSPERRINIYFYEKERDRAVWLASMEEQKLPLPLVWGPNWIVVAAGDPTTAMERIKSIRGVLGGTVEDFSPKKK